MNAQIERASAHFAKLVQQELDRIEKVKSGKVIDFKKIDTIIIGVVAGDGIGPIITEQAATVMRHMLTEEIKTKKVEIRVIEGLTIENRIKEMAAIPPNVLAQLKECHVILKGPTTTPDKDSGLPNIESANVKMRKELDLFANVRPVSIPHLGIDWCFFRENTEGAYAVGSQGVNVNDDLGIDFTIQTRPGTERIARAAYEYAVANGKTKIAVVTKANVVKTTDGNFLTICKEVAKDYPSLVIESWYIDIMTAKLINDKSRRNFEVFVLPNLYGDIITDEAAEIQGGVGTGGSANIGSYYSMFEAIHGSAPRMITEGRGAYADPRGMITATKMLLSHAGFQAHADKLGVAIDKLANVVIRAGQYTGDEYMKKLLELL
jgi:isocitrate dehydrogenase (NAD+)